MKLQCGGADGREQPQLPAEEDAERKNPSESPQNNAKNSLSI
jgi:hypothetical protein